MNKSTAPPLQSSKLCAIIIIATPTGLKNSARYVYSNAQWGDLLTYYNGQNITYDALGNPLKYYNGNKFAWDGRQMKVAITSSGTYGFKYNEDGLRAVKMSTLGVVTNYYYLNGLLIAEETNGDIFIYHYTSGGSIIGMSYRNTSYASGIFDTYIFEKNIFGDIVAVYDLNGNKLVSYKYDAWGNFTISYHNGTATNSVAARNPFKYRGYYYDSDIRLYYLQTRYYDSVTGRFINADGYVSTGQGILGNNMFAYCNNNPVMFTDPTGDLWKPLEKISSFLVNSYETVKAKIDNTIQTLKDGVPSKEVHYSRNEMNEVFPLEYKDYFFEEDEWDDDVAANCHQFSAENRDNKKLVSKDGKYEVIYDANGKLVTDPRDIGTYNFASPKDDPLGHFLKDVVPWFIYGNSEQDTTTKIQRLGAFVGIYW